MTTYNVTARRWAHGWELDIDGVGVTQSRALGAPAERMIRDYIALDRGDTEARRATIVITAKVEGLDEQVAEVRDLTKRMLRMQDEVGTRSRRLVTAMRGRGLSGTDMAAVLGVSPQRVSQLAAATRKTTTTAGRRVAAKSKAKGSTSKSKGKGTTVRA